MNDWLNMFYVNFRKDFLEAYSYKMQFYGSYLSIFFTLIILHIAFEYHNPPQNNDFNSAFLFFLSGIVFLEFNTTLSSASSSSIVKLKSLGIFEQIMMIPRNQISILLSSIPFALFNSFFRFCIYAAYIFLFYTSYEFTTVKLTLIALNILLLSCCLISLGLIFASFTILYQRQAGILKIFTGLSILAGGIFYPPSVLGELLSKFSLILPIAPFLENFRFNFGIIDISAYKQKVNLLNLFVLAIIYSLIAVVACRKSLQLSREKGSLRNY